MRNLKKLLSVVLVVAMIAGLCAVGSFSAAAAEYSEVTNYKEAAAVITGVGVMDGYEDGTMQYDKTVTREEAAAIICRALIGVDTAKKLSTAVAPFADVAANRWSAPYINYLKSQGIVNGKTATQFDPTAEVTAVEFAKMMLCAVGYGKAGEFVGASWDVNTITAANNNGVYTGTLAADLTAPATREQCMLYAFNTMTRVPVVNYNSAFQSYYVGTSVVSGIDSRVAGDAIGVSTNNPAWVPANGSSYDYTLAYRNFKLERANAGTDDYGRDAVKWTANGKAVAEEVTSKAADYTLYGRVTSAELYNTLGKAVVKDINDSYVRFTAYTNGVKYDTDGNTTTTESPITVDIKSGENMVNAISGAGDTVELYVTETAGVYSVKAVVISQYFAQVTKVDTSANKLYATILTGAGSKYTQCVADGDDVNITGLKKDDYIIVNANNNGAAVGNGSVITAIYTPKTAVGTYNGTTFMGLARDVDGNMTFTNGTMDSTLDWTVGNQYTFYYDTLGNIVYSKFYDAGEAEGSASYFYVKSAEVDDGTSILNGSTATLALDVVYTNGGEEVVKVAVNKDNGGKYVTISDPNATVAANKTVKYYFAAGNILDKDNDGVNDKSDFAGFFRYSKGADGFVKLSVPNATYATADNTDSIYYNTAPSVNKIYTNAAGTASLSKKANSSTVLTVVDSDGKVNTYTGFSKFPKNLQTTATTYCALYTYASGSEYIKTICLYTKGTIAAASNLALCGGFWSHTSAGDSVIFYIDGEYKFITFDTDDQSLYVANTVYEVALSDNGNTATAVTAEYTGASKVGTVNENQGSYFTPSWQLAYNNYTTATNIKGGTNAYMGLGHVNPNDGKIDEYFAWSVIDDVDANIFTTKSVKAGEADPAVYTKGGVDTGISSLTYYFDSNTKMYDCRDNKCVKLTELPVGTAFIAYINEELYAAVSDVAYCEYIWIVG